MNRNRLTHRLVRGLYLSAIAALLVLLAFGLAQSHLAARAASTGSNNDQASNATPPQPPPLFSKSFAPDPITAGGVSTLTFTIDNAASSLAASNLDFTDNLPDEVIIATPPNASTTCTGGTLTATSGTSTISYSGGSVGAGSSCTVSVDVTSSTGGQHTNTSGDLTSSAGNSGTATDTLTVQTPSITATKTYELVVDNDGDGKADPGDTLRYTITITNDGTADATNVVFSDTIDANTTLSGTVKTSPLARNDSYSATGNVQITVNGVLDNDSDPDGGAITVSAFQNPSANGGDVDITAPGVLTYDPPPGFEGADTFTYTIQDTDNLTDTATVTVTVNDMIWFLDNSQGAAGDGRLHSPFNTLAAFEAINGNGGATDPKAGDCIFVDTGSGDYAGGVTLEDNQVLVGEGATDTIANVCGITLAPNSDALPNTSGTRPNITDTPGTGHGITLAANNEIRGLNVGNTDTGFGIAGSNVGTATITEALINGSGGLLDINTGTLAMTFDSLTSTNSAAEGMDLDNVGGSLTVNGVTDIDSPSNAGIAISNSTGTFTFSSVDIDSSGGDGISLSDNDTTAININGGNIDGTTGDGIHSVNTSGLSVNLVSFGANTAIGGDGIEVVNSDATSRTVSTTNSNIGIGNATTNRGIFINSSGSGTLTATLTSNAITSTNQAILTNDGGTAGSLVLDLQNSTLTTSAANTFTQEHVGSGLNSTIVRSWSGPNQVVGSPNGSGGILFNRVTFDASGTALSGAQVAVGGTGTIQIGQAGGRVQGDGLSLLNPTGDLSIPTLNIYNNGGTGLEVDTKGLGTTFSLAVGGGTIDTTGGPATFLDPLTGNLNFGAVTSTSSVVGSGTAAQSSSNGTGVFVDGLDASGGAAANALTITTLNVINSTNAGLDIQNSTGTFTFGATTINNSATVGGGVEINNNSADTITVNFNNGLDIDTDTGIGIVVNGTGGTATSFNVVDAATETIDSTGEQAIDIDDATLNAAFDSVSATTGSGENGIQLDQSTTGTLNGTLTINGGTLTNTAGAGTSAIDIGNGTTNNSGGSVTFTYAGTVNNTSTSNTSHSVSVQELAGGTVTISGNVSDSGGGIFVSEINNGTAASVTFSGATKALSTDDAPAVTLTDNTNGTINFTNGGLDIDTTTGTGFNATGGGTVNVTGTGNTINKTSGSGGTGLTINHSSNMIGGNGVQFDSISVAAGTTSGIVLQNTTGQFTVGGDGTLVRNGSGGTITGTTDDAISLTEAENVTLQSMNLTNNGSDAPADGSDGKSINPDHTVQINGGSNVVLSGVLIQNPTASAWIAFNLQGTNRINNDSLIEGVDDDFSSAVRVVNTDTDLTLLQIKDSTFQDADSGQSNVLIEQQGTSNMTFEVLGSTFTDLFPQAVQAAAGQTAGSTGKLTTRIGGPNVSDGNTFKDAKGTDGENNAACVLANGATHSCLIQNNLFENIAKDGGIANTSVVRTQNNLGTAIYEVRDNTLKNFTFSIGARHGIGYVCEPADNSSDAKTSLIIDGNTIDDLPDREGIFINLRELADDGNITISNNQIGQNGTIGGDGSSSISDNEAIDIEIRGESKTVNLLIEGNSVTLTDAGADSTREVIFVEGKDDVTVNVTIRNNPIISTNATGNEIEVEAEDAGVTVNASISGNTLSGGAGTIDLDSGSGTLNVEQLAPSAATDPDEIDDANGIPHGNVIVSGTPTYGSGAPTLPTHPPL